MTEGMQEGIRLYRRGKYGDALTRFLSIPVSETGESTDLAYFIGLCFARMEKYEDAIVYLEQVVTVDENLARVYQCRLMLAVAYIFTGRTRLANFELKKLIDSGYTSPQVFSALGYLSHSFGEDEESLNWYEKALEMDESSTTALNGLGYILADAGKDLTRALSLCKKAFDGNPENPAYLDSLGWVYYKLGLAKEAKTYMRRAREKSPHDKIIEAHYAEISKMQE